MFVPTKFVLSMNSFIENNYEAKFLFLDDSGGEVYSDLSSSFGGQVQRAFKLLKKNANNSMKCQVIMDAEVCKELSTQDLLLQQASLNKWQIETWNAPNILQLNKKEIFSASFYDANPAGILASIAIGFKKQFRQNRDCFGIRHLQDDEAIKSWMITLEGQKSMEQYLSRTNKLVKNEI